MFTTKFAVGFLAVFVPLQAQLAPVGVQVSGGSEVNEAIRTMVVKAINGTEGVQVSGSFDEADFKVVVNVKPLRSDRGIFAFAASAVVYGDYDRKILDAVLTEMKKSVPDGGGQDLIATMQFAAKGNVFLVSHPSVFGGADDLEALSRDIAASLGKAVPAWQQMRRMLASIRTSATPRTQPSVGRQITTQNF